MSNQPAPRLRSIADFAPSPHPPHRACLACNVILGRLNPACPRCRDGGDGFGPIERARAIRRMSIIRPGDREAEIESRGERENGVRAMEDGR